MAYAKASNTTLNTGITWEHTQSMGMFYSVNSLVVSRNQWLILSCINGLVVYLIKHKSKKL
jgi:hypothetical protein